MIKAAVDKLLALKKELAEKSGAPAQVEVKKEKEAGGKNVK